MSSFAKKRARQCERKNSKCIQYLRERQPSTKKEKERENEENFHLEAGKLLEDIFLSSLYRNEHDKYGK